MKTRRLCPILGPVEGWRNRIRAASAPVDVEVDAGGPDAVGYLTKRFNHDAVTLPVGEGQYVLFFRRAEPTVSELFEEFSHVLQDLRQEHADRSIQEMSTLREIAVCECLERNADKLGIPDDEREQTSKLLESYRSQLEKLEAWR